MGPALRRPPGVLTAKLSAAVTSTAVTSTAEFGRVGARRAAGRHAQLDPAQTLASARRRLRLEP